MNVDDHRRLAERLVAAINTADKAAMAECLTEDVVIDWPQSNERVRGLENMWGVTVNYPGGTDSSGDDMSIEVTSPAVLKLVAPTFTVVSVEGGGNTGTVVLKANYPDGLWRIVTLYRLRGSRMEYASQYFAPDYPAPEWRAQWVEKIA